MRLGYKVEIHARLTFRVTTKPKPNACTTHVSLVPQRSRKSPDPCQDSGTPTQLSGMRTCSPLSVMPILTERRRAHEAGFGHATLKVAAGRKLCRVRRTDIDNLGASFLSKY